jgi:cyclophilin family peptidyl-prolyl cis-trans isomerase
MRVRSVAGAGVSGVIALLLAACSAGESPAPTATSVPASTATTAPAASGKPVARVGGSVVMATPGVGIDVNKRYTAVFKTEVGEFRVELYPKQAPKHVDNFVYLARSGYYDGVTFHRVIPGFMAQSGDPTGTGAGGPGWVIPDEISDLKHSGAGILSMAKQAAPNTGGSQFFITFGATDWLDGIHTVFGKVVDGMDVVSKIRERNPSAQPPEPPGTRISTIEIVES